MGKYSPGMIAFISGIALLSDGYVNNSIGSVLTLLKNIYPEEIVNSVAFQQLASCAFIGVVFGQLSFGWVSDKFGRKTGMIAATLILIGFTIACSVAYMPDGLVLEPSIPTGSVAASEAASEVNTNNRHSLFIAVTNCAINFGFILSALVVYVLVLVIPDNLNLVWRLTIGLGAIIPCSILYFRLQIGEAEVVQYIKYNQHAEIYSTLVIGLVNTIQKKVELLNRRSIFPSPEPNRFGKITKIIQRLAATSETINIGNPLNDKALTDLLVKSKKDNVPFIVLARYYGFRLFAISFVWFVYDFSSYAFSLYASTITESVLPKGASLATTFGWTTLVLCFYLPGAILGAPFTDRYGPKFTLLVGLVFQAIFGILLACFYGPLSSNIALFSICYDIFISFGEMGPGNNIGVLASSSSATVVRGRFYGIAAAVGKVGAFVGTYVFPIMQDRFGNGHPNSVEGQRGPFIIASCLNLVAAVLAYYCIDEISQDCVREEDEAFHQYLVGNLDMKVKQ